MPDQYMKAHSLDQYQGKWVVLYFYPKDDTPGCTTEACNFRDDIFNLRALDAEVLGVSLDSTESHARFAEKYGLPFPLLSDAAGEVGRAIRLPDGMEGDDNRRTAYLHYRPRR